MQASVESKSESKSGSPDLSAGRNDIANCLEENSIVTPRTAFKSLKGVPCWRICPRYGILPHDFVGTSVSITCLSRLEYMV